MLGLGFLHVDIRVQHATISLKVNFESTQRKQALKYISCKGDHSDGHDFETKLLEPRACFHRNGCSGVTMASTLQNEHNLFAQAYV